MKRKSLEDEFMKLMKVITATLIKIEKHLGEKSNDRKKEKSKESRR
jgi:hypothetical protein